MALCSGSLWIYFTFVCNLLLPAVHGQSSSYHVISQQGQGSISNSAYPKLTSNLTNEMWYIKVLPGKVLTLSFRDVNIEESGSCGLPSCCMHNWLSISDGTVSGRRKFCGNNLPEPYISSSSEVIVKFHVNKVVDGGRGFLLEYLIGNGSQSTCPSDMFHCDNGHCILDKWRCNRMDECTDGSDETNCHWTSSCHLPGYISCGLQEDGCFDLHSQRCDGVPDCLSGKDELGCEPCGRKEFRCATGDQCYEATRRCDGIQDCADFSDELHCGICEFRCDNGRCIPKLWFCNGVNDCGDESDELGCEELTSCLQPGYVHCGWKERGCYDVLHQRCDGVFDCSSGQDELGCKPCGVKEFRCATGNQCYKISQRCDGITDCSDFSDEVHCGFCPTNHTRCGPHSNQCYDPVLHRCNKKLECSNGEDEKGCGGEVCQDKILCQNTQSFSCYLQSQRCNGIAFCDDASDESDCSEELCNTSRGTFLCHNRRCIREILRCDQIDDCDDGSDEDGCLKNSVITAAVMGSLICGLLLVIAIGCTCKLYSLRLSEQRLLQYESSPMFHLEDEFLHREPPPSYSMAMGVESGEISPALLRSLRIGRRARRLRRQRQNRSLPSPPPPVIDVEPLPDYQNSAEHPSQHSDTDSETNNVLARIGFPNRYKQHAQPKPLDPEPVSAVYQRSDTSVSPSLIPDLPVAPTHLPDNPVFVVPTHTGLIEIPIEDTVSTNSSEDNDVEMLQC